MGRVVGVGCAFDIGTHFVVLYLGLFALQSSSDDKRTAWSAGAVLLLVGFVNIPVIHFSVEWWNTLHQPATLSKFGAPSMPGGNAVAAINNDAGVFILFLDRVIVAGAKYLTGKGRHLGGTNGGGKIMEGVMETLRMGGYGGYVWGVYLLAILVLWSNLALARRQKKNGAQKSAAPAAKIKINDD